MKKSILFLLTIFNLFPVSFLYAANNYTLIDLGNMGSNWTYASSINNNGVVVGNIGYPRRIAFKWVPNRRAYTNERLPFGNITILPDDMDDYDMVLYAYSINDKNEIAGSSSFPDAIAPYAVMWDKDLNLTPIIWAGPGRDINSSSHVIVDCWYTTPLIWIDGEVSAMGDDFEFIPYAMNDLDQVVGRDWNYSPVAAILWEDGVTHDLNEYVTKPGVRLTGASDINNLGQIIGEIEVTGDNGSIEYSSFLFSDGEVSDLGFEDATATNDNSQIVGSHFLYDNDGHLYDLNDLIKIAVTYSCDIPGRINTCSRRTIAKYTDLEVEDINNRGQIVGSAIIEGAEHAVLLNPIAYRNILRPPTNFRVVPE